jgi:membrane protein implicated in regulation of membrane protease activity
LLVFATIFAVGFLMLVFNLIFGGDVADNVDIDHDVGGDAGDGPSVLSLRMLALLMVGFGAVSFGMSATTDATMFACSMGGVGGALVVGAVGYVILRAFYSSQASSTVTDQDVIGENANLIDGIGEGGHGQVAVVVRGREMTYLARSRDDQPIPKGTPVRIVSKVGNTVTVEKLE